MSASAPSRRAVIAALVAVYLIWGSTYLAIRYAVQTIPPFLMASARFLAAGLALYAWARARGAPNPKPTHWRSATVIGGLMLLGGNGGVVWSEQRVPSGIAALMVATVPLWMVVLEWIRCRRIEARPIVLAALVLGLLGIALLVDPAASPGHLDWIGAAVLVAASLSWALGSISSRVLPLPLSSLLSTAMEMIVGGALLALAGLATGESARLQLSAISPASAWALAYLAVFGSLVAFTAYAWLLRVASLATVSTYAYVNPVVAVVLGWAIAGEPLTGRTLLAASVIVTAVALIITNQSRVARARAR